MKQPAEAIQQPWRRYAAGVLAGIALTSCESNPSSSTLPPAEQQIIAPAPTLTAEPDPQNLQHDPRFTKQPTWQADFDKQPNGPLSDSTWNIYTGPAPANDEAEYYTDDPENIRISDHSLALEAVFNGHNHHPFTSARIDTLHKQSFKYGKFVVRAELPSGIGPWPAVWLLNTKEKYHIPHVESDSNYVNGELDIIEAVGATPHTVYGISHYYDEPESGYFNTAVVPNNDHSYHDYALTWTPQTVAFSVDGKVYHQYQKPEHASFKTWPYDQPYYLIANLALGGSWGAGNKHQYPHAGIDTGSLPATMHIQHINYYAYTGE